MEAWGPKHLSLGGPGPLSRAYLLHHGFSGPFLEWQVDVISSW